MTINEYQMACKRTESRCRLYNDDYIARVLQGAMGLNGESGEVIDILKKHMFQGHVLDTEHLAKELGDVAWYLAITADAIGYTLEDVFKMNIEKLKERYPEGFDEDKSQHRAVGDI